MTTQHELHLACGDVPHRRGEIAVGQSAQHSSRTTFSGQNFSISAESECGLAASQPIYFDCIVAIETPDHGFLISSLGRKVNLVGTESDLTYSSRMAPQDFHLYAAGDVPNTHCVVAYAYKIISFRTKDSAVHLPSVTLKFSHVRSASAIPKSHDTVHSGSRDQLTVGTERRRVARGVHTQLVNNVLSTGVPQTHFAVHRPCDDKLVVLTKLRAHDFLPMFS